MTASSRPLERGVAAAAWLSEQRSGDGDVTALVMRSAGTVAAGCAVACGGVIAVRRLSAAIAPADATLLWAAVAAGVPLVLAADAARRAGAALAVPVAARIGLVLTVGALALPPRAAGPAGWLGLAAAVAAAAVVVGRMPATRGGVPSLPRGRADDVPPARGRHASERRRRQVRAPQPGLLRQRFERRELPAGEERVRGRVVVAVPAGSRTGYGHLGFCPAFASTPTVEVTTAYDGVEATVSAAEVLPWGVRVECRLAEPAEEPVEIPVDLVALASAS